MTHKSYLNPDTLPQPPIRLIALSMLLQVPSDHAKVMPHNNIPLLKLIEILQLLNPLLLLLIEQLIVDLDHRVDLDLLEAGLQEALSLVLHHRVGFDADERAAPAGEVLHHHLAETVVRVEHLVVEEEADVEVRGEGGEDLVEFVGVDVADYALAEE